MLIEHDPDEEAWVTYVRSLGYLSTFGDTRDEAVEHTREAIQGYLEAAAKEAPLLSNPLVGPRFGPESAQ